jgi:hypothetical protein
MNYKETYQKLRKSAVPLEITLNTIFVLDEINQAYFISFKKCSRKYEENIFDIVDSITFICHDIKVLKLGETAIILYHSKNSKIFDKVKLSNVNNYLNHPKVYDNIRYGIKYSLVLDKIKIYKTASFNLKEDLEEFELKINLLKKKIEVLLSKLKIIKRIELQIEKWYSKNYLVEKLKTGLNLDQKKYLIKVLESAKFNKLSLHLSKNIDLINTHKLELSVLISYIKTHKIIEKRNENLNWELLLIESIFNSNEM